MGADDRDEPPAARRCLVRARRASTTLLGHVRRRARGRHRCCTTCTTLPPDLPIGYHELRPTRRRARRPGSWSPPRRGPLPERAWGWAVQLYATRSSGAGASATSADLRDLATLVSRHGRQRRHDQPAPRPATEPAPRPEPVLRPPAASTATSCTCGSRTCRARTRCPTSPVWPSSGGPSTPAPPSTAPRSTG